MILPDWVCEPNPIDELSGIWVVNKQGSGYLSSREVYKWKIGKLTQRRGKKEKIAGSAAWGFYGGFNEITAAARPWPAYQSLLVTLPLYSNPHFTW